ncbi:hypothetical protein Desor_5164 [Desulfosporosinus orientis DSM 765]|uniref:Uncharacterized protein n=1 Tax=Desulfosporosinus orientis (strain ATCC 19365 / DSM 765 / NCIMB 8382 / VKM B-1628 / Singapore I) TaxID=768706 RepID=G7W744_DESOD|nr:hypothetical protein [Desulfosporosinus orientis]AET70552.1 hypothetical protein Desor_5164 [Desulfosporosinus orientis DSM 765]
MSDEEFRSLVLKELSDIRRDVAQTQQMTADLIRIVGNTNGMLEEAQQDIDVMKRNIDVIKQDIDIVKQEQKRMSDIQEQQGRVLEMLSYRSLAHDADIRDLRRVR